MKFGKVILAVFVFAFVFNCAAIYAQDSKFSRPIRILNNYGSIPFEDGKTVIAEVKFTGLDEVDRDFQKVLREDRALITVNEIFYGDKVSKAVKALKKWLLYEGYLTAEVAALGEKLPNNQMRLIFEIKKGAPALVSEIRFIGNKSISSEEFVENIKQNAGDAWKIFNAEKYEYYTKKYSRELALGRGYFRVKINRVTPQFVGDSYVVTVEIDEGARFRVGEIKVRGAKIFSEKEILAKLGQKTGDVVDAKNLQELVYERLKRDYADKGYILYDAEFEVEFFDPQSEDSDATANILINIDEGRQFKLGKISFAGIDEEKARELKQILGLSEGAIYNQSKLEEGIRKINDLKEFYPIDIDSDVELRTGRELEQETKSADEIIQIKDGVVLRGRNEADDAKNKQNSSSVSLVIKVSKIQK